MQDPPKANYKSCIVCANSNGYFPNHLVKQSSFIKHPAVKDISIENPC